MRLVAGVFAAALITASSAAGYAHFIHYLNSSSPYQAVPEKFDLNSLPNRTVMFQVADSGPAQLAPGDSFASVLAQIRQATQVWNSVASSDLRVAFGGLFSPGVPQSTPGGEIVFEELPPGVLGAGGPTARADLVTGPNGPFIPITRATVRLNLDLTRRPAPSYTEAFFATVVHEMGHALGLQHTFTSNVMSVGVTRSTYRLQPLDSDDVAGISLLYPASTFAAATGTISGRVTSGGQGLHMASVVAIRPNGSAVSALTNPDGTYQIQGIPPDQYTVYVHPLPPTADMVLPLGPDGKSVEAAGGSFQTIFFPGTRDPNQAVPIGVARGGRVENIDFSVQRKAAVSIYDVSIYSFAGNPPQAVSPAFLNSVQTQGTLAVRGPGLIVNGAAASGLSVQVLGGGTVPPNWIRAYGNPVALAIDVPITQGLTGPRHLVFSTPDDIYVLPSAYHLVQKQPPVIGAVTPNTEGTISILGMNLGSETRFFLDGIPAPLRGISSNGEFITATVALPAGYGNTAVVTAYNPDGQNSTFGQSMAFTTTIDGSASPSVRVEPASIPAGTSALVEVNATSTRFSENSVLGFGSSDVLVRRTWVLSPTRLIADVTVAPGATPTASLLSVISGFHVIAQPFGFQITQPNARAPRISSVVTATGAGALYPGTTATLNGFNLTTGSATTVTLNDVRANIVVAGSSVLTFQVPSSLGAGPAVLRLFNGQENALPVLVAIEIAPPVIVSMTPANGRLADGVKASDVMNTVISDPGGSDQLEASRVRVRVGDTEITPAAVVPAAGLTKTFQVMWIVPQGLPVGDAPVRVRIDERLSDPMTVPIRGQ